MIKVMTDPDYSDKGEGEIKVDDVEDGDKDGEVEDGEGIVMKMVKGRRG